MAAVFFVRFPQQISRFSQDLILEVRFNIAAILGAASKGEPIHNVTPLDMAAAVARKFRY